MNANRVQGGGATLGGREGAKVCWVLSSEQFPPDQLVRFGQKAEQAGFDGVWSSDHWQPWQDNQGHSGQAWVTLSSVGALTNNVFFGTGVTCPTYRYAPAVVAQAFATLGILYPGRVFLGVGSGEAINELAATGQWDEYGTRAARLEEAVQVIRQLWTGEIVNHDGRFYRVNGKLYDVPRVPVPMYIAANGKKSFHTAGMYGDGLDHG